MSCSSCDSLSSLSHTPRTSCLSHTNTPSPPKKKSHNAHATKKKFGLSHDGQKDAAGNVIAEYYYGPPGGTWAPIMGQVCVCVCCLRLRVCWFGPCAVGGDNNNAHINTTAPRKQKKPQK